MATIHLRKEPLGYIEFTDRDTVQVEILGTWYRGVIALCGGGTFTKREISEEPILFNMRHLFKAAAHVDYMHVILTREVKSVPRLPAELPTRIVKLGPDHSWPFSKIFKKTHRELLQGKATAAFPLTLAAVLTAPSRKSASSNRSELFVVD